MPLLSETSISEVQGLSFDNAIGDPNSGIFLIIPMYVLGM
jgi:hypothetical protein